MFFKYNVAPKSKIVIAFIGPSCSGKDTLSKEVYDNLKSDYENCNYIVSCTTRPKRINEKDGVDYHFLTLEKFVELVEKRMMYEYTEFRDWWYGTSKESIKDGINIGVFNIKGLVKLANSKDCIVYPIYCKTDIKERLKRSVKREGKFKLEHIRRAVVDEKDFFYIEKYLKDYFLDSNYCVVQNQGNGSIYICVKILLYAIKKWASENNI